MGQTIQTCLYMSTAFFNFFSPPRAISPFAPSHRTSTFFPVTVRRPVMSSTKRDQLIDTALRLFAKNGYRATGIDTILAEAGVAKMTLYHHFKSKDELILAALQRRD